MRAIIRCVLLCLAFTSNAHAIVLGSDDASNTYSSVGYTLTTAGGLGSVVALTPNWVLTAAHVVESDPALLVMGNPFKGTEGVYFFFDKVITHPDYVPGEFHDDLALIKLSELNPIIPTPGDVDASFATLSNVALGGGLPAPAFRSSTCAQDACPFGIAPA
jgi:Trypsin